MRKRFLNGKRVMALALALSMVVGEASVVAATPADVSVESVDETTEAPVQETVSENETDTDVPQDDESEDVVEEVADETDEEEIVADEAGYSGKLEKVIGVKGFPDTDTFYNENGKAVIQYTNTQLSKGSISVAGKLEADENSGFYSYGGKLYTSASYDKYVNQTKVYLDSEVLILSGTAESYKDAETGFYLVNGSYYGWINEYYVNGTQVAYYYPENSIVLMEKYTDDYAMTEAINKTYGRYTKSAAYYKQEYNSDNMYAYSPDYYEINGRYFSDYEYSYMNVNGQDIYYAYAYVSNELSFTQQKVNLRWNSQTIPSYAQNAAGKDLKLGYELKVNGEVYNVNGSDVYDADGTRHIVMGNNCEPEVLLAAGQTMTVQVRALYYHAENKTITEDNGTVRGRDYYYADSYGEWSDTYTYTAKTRTAVPVVTSVSAAKVTGDTEIKVNWSAVAQANYYYIYELSSKKALTVTAANFKDLYQNSDDTEFLTANGLVDGDLTTNCYYEDNDSYGIYDYDEDYMYHYYAVVSGGVADADLYYNDNSLFNISVVSAAVVTRDAKAVNTPAISNFKVEAGENGQYDLSWTPVEANMIIYAYDSAQFPTFYQYSNWGVLREVEGTTSRYNLWNEMAAKDKVELNKVQRVQTYGMYGELNDVTDYFNLQPGKTYYFVAYTYDSTGMNENKQAPLSYTVTVNKRVNGVTSQESKTYNYEYYMNLSTPTSVVSAKLALSKPGVATMPNKDSVKLTMTGHKYTGYEIYRKSGSKYKKVATITNDVYTDSKLKTNTSYSYKVRSYSYDRDSKKTYYSNYNFVTIKTGVAANIDLTATKASTTSVKLKWTKVADASKYEIYRCNSENYDPKVISKKYSASGIASVLNNARYELVKTINKAKTVSYTDKKLTAGISYTYVVIAYYKNGKTIEYVTATDDVAMMLEAPENVKAVCSGTKVKVSWDAEKYASKYEIRYVVYAKDGTCKTDTYVKASTKKTSYTISGIENGGYVVIQVRAYGKDKKYSGWSNAFESKNMAAVKNIKAVVKKVDGKNTVKISWKKVSGAKYYKVYRSTIEGRYYADEKVYDIEGDNIAKESNADYVKNSYLYSEGSRTGNSEVLYCDYNGVQGSIVGTSAYDNADLSAGVTYYYSVIAYADIPVGAVDSYVSSEFTTKPAAVVAGVSATVKATNSKKGQVKLTFDKATGASSYTVYRAVKNGSKVGTFTKIGTAKKTATSYTDKKAKKGKTYVYKIVPNGSNALKANYTLEMMTGAVKVKK